MRHASPLFLCFLALTAAACDGAASPEGASASALRGAEPHANAVARCDARHEAEASKADSTLAMIHAEAEWSACLFDANDRAVETIEANLVDAGSSLVGSAAVVIEAQRSAHESLCAERDKASPNFGGSLSRVEAMACRAQREHVIARLMEGFVAFGAEPMPLAEARAEHPRCYAAYDVQIGAAMSTHDMIQATTGLSACVLANVDKLVGPLAQIQVDNDAKHGDLPAASARIRAVVDEVDAAGQTLCHVLNEAGENGIGSLSRVTAGTCQARISESVHADIKETIGE
jgi:hypothetical protein